MGPAGPRVPGPAPSTDRGRRLPLERAQRDGAGDRESLLYPPLRSAGVLGGVRRPRRSVLRSARPSQVLHR